MDSLNSPIAYSFLSGSPASYPQFFEINPSTGIVKQVKPVESSSVKKFEIIIKVLFVCSLLFISIICHELFETRSTCSLVLCLL